ncbi:MAG: hypothetical protein LC104_15510 [Bacteroidales bacterium]|nr:hypothetical protein [Bacteroidales bacterium]
MTHTQSRSSRASLTVAIPLQTDVESLERSLTAWNDVLARTGREYTILLVLDTLAPDCRSRAEKVCQKLASVRLLMHESPRGFGACLRTAYAESRSELFFYTALDYPYTPADLLPMLQRIDDVDELMQKPLDVVVGCRRGLPVPGFWAAVGQVYRRFCRVALGLPREKLPGWLGWREHRRAWQTWFLFGNPLNDPNVAFKLFRKSLLDRFPIQCDGDFVHVELIAKATFLTALMDEQPLTPVSAPIPRTQWGECRKLLTQAQFHPPITENPGPADPPETVLSAGGIDGDRSAAEPTVHT